MDSINEVTILGNIGADPKMYEGNTPRAAFNVATSRKYKDANQQTQTKTTWHRVVCFGRQAENVCNYFKKGSPIWVRGRLETREYQKQDGTKATITEIIMESFKFMDSKRDADQGYQPQPQQQAQYQPQPQQQYQQPQYQQQQQYQQAPQQPQYGNAYPSSDDVPF